MENNVFALKNKKEECPGVFTLEFFLAEGRGFDFRAGQFVTFRILKDGLPGNFGKAYTITSLPGDDSLAITVKKIGSFSGALCGLEISDKVSVTGPYGNFYPSESDKKDVVFLAGGIGITPFYAVIKDFYKRGIDNSFFLFYSNRNKEDIVFLKEFDEILKRWKKLKIIHVLTRTQEKYPDIKEYERINTKMIKKYLGDLSGKDYFICGPSNFVSDMRDQLKNAGVEHGSLKIEAFY